jgi:hypothetical protein
MLCVRYIHLFIRDKHIFPSERMLRKDYDRKGSIEKKNLAASLKGLDAKTNWLAVNRQVVK